MSQDDAAKIKAAASLLIKGGTLTREPCSKCGGVQVRSANNITCINCGNQEKSRTQLEAANERSEKHTPPRGLAFTAAIIEEKIASLSAEVKNESDISMQKQMAEILESYLRILEKTKSMIT